MLFCEIIHETPDRKLELSQVREESAVRALTLRVSTSVGVYCTVFDAFDATRTADFDNNSERQAAATKGASHLPYPNCWAAHPDFERLVPGRTY